MIDLHSHILRGVDDGARSLEQSLEIARAAVADGITAIAATPHVRDDWPTDAGVMEYRVAELRAELEQAQIPLDIRPGGEIALDWLVRMPEDELRRFALAGNPRYLLIEMPYFGWSLRLPDELFALVARGVTPVLAHPERNSAVQRDPARLRPLVDAGVLVQVTAASLDGRLGAAPRECGLRLIGAGLAHMLVSDAHHASVREVGLTAAANAVASAELAAWLTQDVPAAILSDTELPPRPQNGRHPGFFARLFGT
ncbi:MAG TPA: CpsB/CapC family capsule biosynthesis tyrosine phosphatase [Gaiellaceae bacterium]|nr:CpsB/CapC family capsule biosynthesis tyrosine phosphatase [Gaiellaceae bacterium]